MARIKYYYNTRTGAYEQAKTCRGPMILKATSALCGMLLMSLGLLSIYFNHFQTPKERILSKQIQDLEFDYDRLNEKVYNINGILASIEQRDDKIYRLVLGAEPIEKSVREAGVGGADRYADIRKKNVGHSELIIALYEKVDRARRKLYIESRSQDQLIQLAEYKEKLYAAIPAIQPLASKDLKRLSSKFGARIHPIDKKKRKHLGIDFSAKLGAPVYATADGIISKTEVKLTGYGKQIEIDHGFGYRTRYAHMHGFAVKKGRTVKRGDLIGYVGNTGLSTGAHLHYEVFHNGRQVDPLRYFFNDITAAEYKRILEAASAKNVQDRRLDGRKSSPSGEDLGEVNGASDYSPIIAPHINPYTSVAFNCF